MEIEKGRLKEMKMNLSKNTKFVIVLLSLTVAFLWGGTLTDDIADRYFLFGVAIWPFGISIAAVIEIMLKQKLTTNE